MPELDLIDAQQRIVDLRQRVLAGEDISPEVLAEALQTLRKARETALLATPKRKSKKKVDEEQNDATS